MFENIDNLSGRYDEIMDEMASGELSGDRLTGLMKEQSELEPIVMKYREYKENEKQINDCLALIDNESDPELKELAKEELSEAKASSAS